MRSYLSRPLVKSFFPAYAPKMEYVIKRKMKARTAFCLLWIALLVWACQSRKEGKTPFAESDAQWISRTNAFGQRERLQLRLPDSVRHGRYEMYNEAGQLIEEAHYRNDSLHGVRVLYYADGDTQIVEHYRRGDFVGLFRAYYEDGQLEAQGQYVDNQMKGEWRRFYRNGQLMEVVTFEENRENGPFIEYHSNGNLKAEGQYLKGDNEHGLLKIYDKSGELKRKMQCEHGVCRTVWQRDSLEM